MLDAAAIETLTRSVMLGTGRQAAPVQKAFGGLIASDDPKAALKALALLGQHSRFRRPARAAPDSAEPLFPDERAIVPEAARPLLRSQGGCCGRGWKPASHTSGGVVSHCAWQ